MRTYGEIRRETGGRREETGRGGDRKGDRESSGRPDERGNIAEAGDWMSSLKLK